MKKNDIVERLVEACTDIDALPENSVVIANYGATLGEALDWLKTYGWHKWPEEKPEPGLHVVIRKDGEGRTAFWNIDGWNDWSTIELWQPFPPLPEKGGE